VDSGDGCICEGACSACVSGGDGAYQKPTLGTVPNEGTVYGVVGSSSKATGTLPLDHPVMVIALREIGALVVDVDGARLDGTWIQRGGLIVDRFTLIKGGDADGDGVPDDVDNCPSVPNPGQEDDGGLLGPEPDGTGNACQCGDLSGNGAVDAGDLSAVQLCLAGAGTCGPLCDADGNSLCEAADLTTLEAALVGAGALVCSP
jgi:hypothetical protein